MQTNQQILEKAILKAVDGGWYIKIGKVKEMHLVPNAGKGIWSQIYRCEGGSEELPVGLHVVGGLYDFIFNHDFAKALWGDSNPEGYMIHVKGETLATEYIDNSWHYHLQQMVISEDPIKYLGENL